MNINIMLLGMSQTIFLKYYLNLTIIFDKVKNLKNKKVKQVNNIKRLSFTKYKFYVKVDTILLTFDY